MEERNRQNMGNISLDIPYLIRRIMRNAVVIFLCAVIAGIGAYVAFDNYLQDSYTAKVNLRVLPRDNKRRIMRNAVVIFLCAVIAGIGAYVAFDNYLQDSYTAKVNLRVLPRDNNSAKLAEGNVNSAAVRNVNVLNSDTMKEMIKKSPTAEGVQGNVYAAQVAGTNLISLSADSDSAEHAFRLLKAATENYPKLAGYFESGYVVNNLENFSVDSIVKNQAQPLKYALAVLMLVILAGVGLTVLIEMLSDKIYSGRRQCEQRRCAECQCFKQRHHEGNDKKISYSRGSSGKCVCSPGGRYQSDFSECGQRQRRACIPPFEGSYRELSEAGRIF